MQRARKPRPLSSQYNIIIIIVEAQEKGGMGGEALETGVINRLGLSPPSPTAVKEGEGAQPSSMHARRLTGGGMTSSLL